MSLSYPNVPWFLMALICKYVQSNPIGSSSHSSSTNNSIEEHVEHVHTREANGTYYQPFTLVSWNTLRLPLSYTLLVLIFGLVLIESYNTNWSKVIHLLCFNRRGNPRCCCRSSRGYTVNEDEEQACSGCCVPIKTFWKQYFSQILARFQFRHLLPESCFLILFGLVGGLALATAAESDFVIRMDPSIFFYGMLPCIVLKAGITLPRRAFMENLVPILIAAFIGTLFNTFVLAGSLYALHRADLVNKGYDNNMLDYIIYGAINSAVDPVSVLALFEKMRLKTSLYITVFGESVLNDAVCVMAFHSAEALKHHILQGGVYSIGTILLLVLQFVLYSIAAALFGVFFGLLATLFVRHFKHGRQMVGYMILAFGYLAYITPEFFHISGIISCFICAAVMSRYTEANLGVREWKSAGTVIDGAALLMEGVIFLLMGVTFWKLPHDAHDSGLVLTTVVVCILARFVFCFAMSALLNLLRASNIPFSDQIILSIAGLRGAIAVGLILMVDGHTVPAKSSFVDATFAMVFITNFVLGALIRPLVWALKIGKNAVIEEDSVFHSYFGRIMEMSMDGVSIIARDNLLKRFMRQIMACLESLEGRFLRDLLLTSKEQKMETTLLNAHRRALQESALEYLHSSRASCQDFDVLLAGSTTRAMAMLMQREDSCCNVHTPSQLSRDNSCADLTARLQQRFPDSGCEHSLPIIPGTSSTLDLGAILVSGDSRKDKEDTFGHHLDDAIAVHSHQRLVSKPHHHHNHHHHHHHHHHHQKKHTHKKFPHSPRPERKEIAAAAVAASMKDDVEEEAEHHHDTLIYQHVHVPLHKPRPLHGQKSKSSYDIVEALQHVYGRGSVLADLPSQNLSSGVTPGNMGSVRKTVSFAAKPMSSSDEEEDADAVGFRCNGLDKVEPDEHHDDENVIYMMLDRGNKLKPIADTAKVFELKLVDAESDAGSDVEQEHPTLAETTLPWKRDEFERSGSNHADQNSVNPLDQLGADQPNLCRRRKDSVDPLINGASDQEQVSAMDSAPHLLPPWCCGESENSVDTEEPTRSLMMFSRMSMTSDMAISSHRSERPRVCNNNTTSVNGRHQQPTSVLCDRRSERPDSVRRRKSQTQAYTAARHTRLGIEDEKEEDEVSVSEHRVELWLNRQPFLEPCSTTEDRIYDFSVMLTQELQELNVYRCDSDSDNLTDSEEDLLFSAFAPPPPCFQSAAASSMPSIYCDVANL